MVCEYRGMVSQKTCQFEMVEGRLERKRKGWHVKCLKNVMKVWWMAGSNLFGAHGECDGMIMPLLCNLPLLQLTFSSVYDYDYYQPAHFKGRNSLRWLHTGKNKEEQFDCACVAFQADIHVGKRWVLIVLPLHCLLSGGRNRQQQKMLMNTTSLWDWCDERTKE